MDLESMSTEDIENNLRKTINDIAVIKSQVEYAKAIAASTGEYSDANWFQRASSALRFKGRDQQLMQRELGIRRKKEQSAKNSTIERYFINTAKIRLDPAIFNEIMNEAVENHKLAQY